MPALFDRRFLVGARRAAEGFVAVREAAEAVDDVEMFLRIILEHRVVEPAEQPQRFALIADVLAVLAGQAGELAPLVGPGLVPPRWPDAAPAGGPAAGRQEEQRGREKGRHT